MARIRTIKPEFFTSLTLSTVSRDARLTFIGLWTYCDDDGRGRDESRLIKAAVWPLDDKVTVDVVERHLVELADAGLVQRYAVSGQRCVVVRNWKEHQKIDRPKASILPPPPSRRAEDAGAVVEPSTIPPRAVDEPSSGERKGKERKEHDATTRRRLSSDEQTVVDHYRTVHPKRFRGDLPDKVLRLLRVALASYPAADLCRAIDGNAASQFHRENGHLGLDLILRDASKIDYFLELAQRRTAETQDMTDDFGRMVPHRRNETGDWVPVVSIA